MRNLQWTCMVVLTFALNVVLSAQVKPTVLNAVKRGDLQRVDSMLIADPSGIAWRGEDKETLLHWAVETNDTSMAALLIERGAPVNAADGSGWTPLHWAAGQGKTGMVKLLLEKGALPDPKTKTKWMPLHWASNKGHADIVQLLLAAGANVNTRSESTLLMKHVGETTSESGGRGTPLHEAARNNHTEVAKLLIENGADLNGKDIYDRFPLHVAARNGHLEMAKLLITSGADVKGHPMDADTPLFEAADAGYPKVMTLLIQNGADVNQTFGDHEHNLLEYFIPLFEDQSVVKCLLDNGIDVNHKDTDGVSAIHVVAWWGRTADMDLLVERGANINAKDNAGGSAIHWAAWNGWYEVIRRLRELGLKEKMGKLCERIMLGDSVGAKSYLAQNQAASKDDCPIPLIHWAVLFRRTELVEPLASAGADVNALVRWEETPFAFARFGSDRPEPEIPYVHTGHFDPFYEEPEEVEAPIPPDGATALSLAANRDRKEIVSVLLEIGARADFRTYGISPLGWAAGRGHLALAELMLKTGAKVNEVDEKGYAPLHRAVISGRVELAHLLLKRQADPNLLSRDAQTALDLCRYGKNQKMEKLIIQRGGKYSKDLPQNMQEWPDY